MEQSRADKSESRRVGDSPSAIDSGSEVVRNENRSLGGVTPNEKIALFGKYLSKMPGAELCNEKSEIGMGCKYEHTFVDHLYIRKMFIPKGLVIVTQIHKTQHPYFIMYGDVSVYLDGETKRIQGPFHGITQPGTQRALLTHEDTLWITVHVTEKTDIEEIGKDILEKIDLTKKIEKEASL